MNVGANIMLTGQRRLPAGAQAPTCYVRMPDGWSAIPKLAGFVSRNRLVGSVSKNAVLNRKRESNLAVTCDRQAFRQKQFFPSWHVLSACESPRQFNAEYHPRSHS